MLNTFPHKKKSLPSATNKSSLIQDAEAGKTAVASASEAIKQVNKLLQDPQNRTAIEDALQSADPGTQKELQTNKFFLSCISSKVSLQEIKLVDPQLLSQTDMYGCLPLHYILAKNPSLEMVQYLVEKHPESLQVENRAGWLPIHKACHYKASTWVVDYLIEKCPASVRIPEKSHGRLPLHIALENQAPLLVVELLISAYPESTTSLTGNGETPLLKACFNQASLDVVEHLVEQHPKAVMQTKIGSSTLPIQIACFRGSSLAVVKFLARKFPASLAFRDMDGGMALHYACFGKSTDPAIVEYLTKQMPEAVHLKTSDGKNCFDLAKQIGRNDFVAILKQHGASRKGKKAARVPRGWLSNRLAV